MAKNNKKVNVKVATAQAKPGAQANGWTKYFTSHNKKDVGAAIWWWVGMVITAIVGLVALYFLYKLLHLIDVEKLGEYIKDKGATVGYLILSAIIFAESGLFFGFFLPGDSLLLTAGLLSSKPAGEILNIFILVPILFVAAVLGDNVGYWFGQKTGPALFSREESLFFKPKNLLAAKKFYDERGGITILLARFMPFIRTFVPIVAGAVHMPYQRFFLFNVFGGLVWAVGLTILGYFLGNIPGVENFFTILVLLVIIISASPTIWHLWSDHKKEIISWVKLRFF